MTTMALSALLAVLLDRWLGEPRRWHPLVGFGMLAERLEQRLYGVPTVTPQTRRRRGVLALLLLLVPVTAVATVLSILPFIGTLSGVLMLYAAIGHQSLHDHARPIADALRHGDEDHARRLAARLVSRDSAALDVSAATAESVLENGNDGVFGALFWFAIAGGPGAVLYRMINTLDAMWGYRNARYRHFGWAAARLDDVFNYVPALLTALTYAILGNTQQALHCWRSQAPAWDSPNAGPVMAAGAGALGLSLGGPARYQGVWHQRPALGVGRRPDIDDIERALWLVRRSVWLWLGVFVIIAGLAYV